MLPTVISISKSAIASIGSRVNSGARVTTQSDIMWSSLPTQGASALKWLSIWYRYDRSLLLFSQAVNFLGPKSPGLKVKPPVCDGCSPDWSVPGYSRLMPTMVRPAAAKLSLIETVELTCWKKLLFRSTSMIAWFRSKPRTTEEKSPCGAAVRATAACSEYSKTRVLSSSVWSDLSVKPRVMANCEPPAVLLPVPWGDGLLIVFPTF